MKTRTSSASQAPAPGRISPRRLGFLTALMAATFLLAAAPAYASKQVINYFGTPPANFSGEKGGEFHFPGAIAVNRTGAGPANQGDVYVIDTFNNRVERFAREDHGTPAPYDDTFSFISAWGTDIVSPGGTGDQGDASAKDYEVCTVAEQCKAGVPAAGNGTALGNGDLGAFVQPYATGIAVDQDTGDVYVTDSTNHRVNEYTGDGTFIRSFGYDVAESGPGSLPGAAEQQKIIVQASGGKFSLLFRGQSTGATGKGKLVAGSKTITRLTTTSGAFAVGQGLSAFGDVHFDGSTIGSSLFPSGTTITKVEPGQLSLSKSGTGSGFELPIFADNLPFNASAAALESSLNSLPTIGGAGGSVSVSRLEKSPTEFEYTITFGGTLAGTDLPALIPSKGGLTIGSGEPSVSVTESARGGAYEVCNQAAGDVCRAGGAGNGSGELGVSVSGETGAAGLAISPPDGNPATGSVFLADTDNHRVDTYNLDGASPSGFGSTAQFGNVEGPTSVAVDSRGILYADAATASGGAPDNRIVRYDTANADGGGIGFLPPILGPANEEQKIAINATTGQYKLTFGANTTPDLSRNSTKTQVREALEALPSVGAGNVSVNDSGDSAAPEALYVTFIGALAATDVTQLIASNGTTPLNGTIAVTTSRDGHSGIASFPGSSAGTGLSPIEGLAVDPDSDGAGPETDILYARGLQSIAQFGPLNAPGLSAPPSAADEEHGTLSNLGFGSGLALDEATGLLYVPAQSGGGQNAHGVYALFTAGSSPPSASIDSVDQITARSALVHATINPGGPPDLTYRLEYSSDGGSTWKSTPTVVLGSQETPQSVQVPLELLSPATEYKLRLLAQRPFVAPVTDEEAFTTLPTAPEVETTGSPVRTATTARLEGRINPAGNAASYRFQYGDQGPCESNPCESTQAKAAGSEDRIELLSEWVEELAPATTYHYRVVGESECEPIAHPGHLCVSEGQDMTLTTSASDAPLTHGHFPGPPGSDRAWEQVNAPDIGGNPVGSAGTFSTNGERALYHVEGGTPFSEAGSSFGSLLFAQREETASHQGSWQTRQITPPRSQLIGNEWEDTVATPDLSTFLSADYDFTLHKANVWRFGSAAPPAELFQSTPATIFDSLSKVGISADGTRALLLTKGGGLDPAYPTAAAQENLYDITSGTPKLLSFLRGNSLAACGVADGERLPNAESHWISADGSHVYFASQGNGRCGDSDTPFQLYMREIAAEQTKLISAPLSGPDCGAIFLRSTPDAVFLWTQSRLSAEDSPPAQCASVASDNQNALDGDVYRYRLSDGSLQCLTCVAPGIAADVPNVGTFAVGQSEWIAVAPDGSRVYFVAQTPLLPGAPPNSLYRVTVATGDLAYLGPKAKIKPEPAHPITPDGLVIVFGSEEAALNPLGGTDNGGTLQYYRYDDTDRSLVCISCPPHGSLPGGAAVPTNTARPGLSADGSDVAFTTPTGLIGADQNTSAAEPEAGTDAYEWRDGRLLLVSDGLTDWPKDSAPQVRGMSASGRDVFFAAPAAYTPDALDASIRLYDARIGGGFDFPEAAKPCPLEVCQGTPKGAPEEQAPGTSDFRGPGNEKTTQHSHKHKKKRHRKHKRQRRANHNRRARR